MSEDALWPRAAGWLTPGTIGEACDLALLGVPAFSTSISATGAHATPAAIRAALARYSTWSWTHGADLQALTFLDFGDIVNPDSPEGEARTIEAARQLAETAGLVIGLGGDNSVTYALAMGAFGAGSLAGSADSVASAGLITLDAHHDIREGVNNGSPVRRLIESGLSGARVVQIGIADFSNSPDYALRALDYGIHVIPRSALRGRDPKDVMAEAVAIAGAGGGPIHVDFDVDVCDRSVVPACPAAAPGGISADELRQFAYWAGATEQVKSVDITEIDATNDSHDERTIRLAALLILELAAGRF